MKATVTEEREVEIKEVRIHAKVRDCCNLSLVDTEGEEVVEHDGYVPSFMPGEHYGDYLILNIDINTGQILNWDKDRVKEHLQEFIDKAEDE